MLEVADVAFQRGDEVISRRQDRELRPAGGARNDYLRNGERGRVVEVDERKRALVVDFDGRGRITVPEDYLSRQVRPGVVGGLAHSYAVTSYVAQGETYAAGRHLGTERSARAGVYVGLSRGSRDVALYMVRTRDQAAEMVDDQDLPRLEDTTTTKEAVSAKLLAGGNELLASEIDPGAGEVAQLLASRSRDELAVMAEDSAGSAARALAGRMEAIASRAQLHPHASLVARLGERPGSGPERATWDRAVGSVAQYRARWAVEVVEGVAEET